MNPIIYLKSVDSLSLQILLTVGLVGVYFIITNLAVKVVKRFGKKRGIAMPRVVYTIKYMRFVTFIFCLMLLSLVWDVSFKGLSVYFISFFTVAGIALFASWSILSNITAAVILFFYFPYRIGERIKIMDGDNSVEGVVFDINMFSIIIKNDEGQKITYPNNLALQKGIIHLKR